MTLTRYRGGVLAVITVAIVALMALMPCIGSASAASQSVSVGSPTNRFTPNVTTINAGDTVTFNWAAGTHTVVFPSGASADLSITSSNTTGQTGAFSTPGTYYYYCSIHAEASDATEAHVQANDAMVGKIVVLAAGSASTPTTAPTAPAATTPTATTPSNGQCVLTVKDQDVPGTKQIIIPRSTQGRAGYIAIHESSATGAPGAVIGITSYQPAGAVYTNLAVGLDRPLKAGEVLWPMLHTEDNGNTTYDGAAVDLPTVDAHCGNPATGNIVTFPMKIAAAPNAPATGSGVVTSSSSNDWMLALGAGLLVVTLISGGTVVAVRRNSNN
jgi:plastocyanin